MRPDNPPLDALRKAVANGKPVDWDVIAPPRRMRCVECSDFYDDRQVASRGLPPLCSPCYVRRMGGLN